MFTLVESFIRNYIADHPDLGCAMLIASCSRRGIKTTLIKGQTRYLKYMFLDDSEELWNLIKDLKEYDCKKLRLTEYKKSIQEKGIKQFQHELKDLYEEVIIDKNPRFYFNAEVISKFFNLHNIFISLYYYYLRNLNYGKLKIIDHYVSEIIKSNPRYIGFSLQGFQDFSSTIAKRMKEIMEIPIIVGGALFPYIDLKKLNKDFEQDYFDYLVIGAGDQALPSLIEKLDNREEPIGIANVFYKKDGKIKGNNLEVINDLDNLPLPDFSQFDLDLYRTPKRILPLQTARGCSWAKCAFCARNVWYYGTYKTFSIEKVIETIRHLQNSYSCSHFVFHDDELPPTRAKRISEAILNSDLKNIYIYAFARPTDGYNNGDLLCLMRKAGLSSISWGLESGSQKVLNLMNKGTKISNIGQILKKSSKNKIANTCFVLFGFPGETKRDAQETVRFLQSHADYIEGIYMMPFRVLLGSLVYISPEKWSVCLEVNDSRSSHSVKVGMSRKEAIRLIETLHAEYGKNCIKITSDKFKYIELRLDSFILHFLNSSQEHSINSYILRCIKKGKVNSIFPIILGEIKKENNKTVFLPINIKETLFINQLLNRSNLKKEKFLDSLEEKMFILSDGTLSIEDITLAIYKDFKKNYRKEHIYKKCTDFFQEIFSKNWGLGFAKSWQ